MTKSGDGDYETEWQDPQGGSVTLTTAALSKEVVPNKPNYYYLYSTYEGTSPGRNGLTFVKGDAYNSRGGGFLFTACLQGNYPGGYIPAVYFDDTTDTYYPAMVKLEMGTDALYMYGYILGETPYTAESLQPTLYQRLNISFYQME